MLIQDVDSPSLLIDLDRVEANLSRAQAYADSHGLALRPHIKTHRLPRFALAQVARDVGQPRSESEGVDLRPAGALGVGRGVQEMQQDLRVARHAAGNVAERHQRRWPHHPAAALQAETQELTQRLSRP